MNSFCQLCSKYYDTPFNRKQHHLRVHPDEKMEDISLEQFKLQIARGDAGALAKWCAKCSKLFSTVCGAKRHARTTHPNDVLRSMQEEAYMVITFYRNKFTGAVTTKITTPHSSSRAAYPSGRAKDAL